MALALTFRNRQKACALDVRYLRRITHVLLTELLPLADADLGIVVVAAPEMTRLNETFLRHAGSTDVITFDYAAQARRPVPVTPLHGEVFVCMDEAMIQARRFRTSWPAELVRYIVHGVLHLRGFDDHTAGARRRMKAEENRLLHALARRFCLSRLAKTRNAPESRP